MKNFKENIMVNKIIDMIEKDKGYKEELKEIKSIILEKEQEFSGYYRLAENIFKIGPVLMEKQLRALTKEDFTNEKEHNLFIHESMETILVVSLMQIERKRGIKIL